LRSRDRCEQRQLEKFRRDGDYSSETCKKVPRAELLVFAAEGLTVTTSEGSQFQTMGQAVACANRNILRNYLLGYGIKLLLGGLFLLISFLSVRH
jgi:hypothetical protein